MSNLTLKEFCELYKESFVEQVKNNTETFLIVTGDDVFIQLFTKKNNELYFDIAFIMNQQYSSKIKEKFEKINDILMNNASDIEQENGIELWCHVTYESTEKLINLLGGIQKGGPVAMEQYNGLLQEYWDKYR